MAGAALPYGPFVAALGHEAEWLLADGSEGDMLAARHRLFLRVLALLASLASRSPLLLVLEDLHWADESSRELLTFLAVRLREAPVLIVGTLREELTDAVRRWRSELEHRPRVTRLRLGTLALLTPIQSKCQRWADDNIKVLEVASPQLPDVLNDRAAECWHILLAIADKAGGEWPERARDAAVKLSLDNIDTETVLTQLLADMRDLFAASPGPAFTMPDGPAMFS